MAKPIISFVIPTYNRCARLCKTLAALQQQAARVDHEIIVLDNGSEDDTAAAVAKQFPQVRLIQVGTNLGAAARNIGLAAAESDLVFMLDDDSWPAAQSLEHIGCIMEDAPSLGAAACYVRRPKPGAPHESGGLPGVFLGGGVVLRKTAAIEVGGYPIDYGYYVEEYDLCARLWQAGWQVRWLGPLLVWHDPAEAGRDKNRIIKLLVANNLRLWSRYAPPERRQRLIDETIERYGLIARKEDALAGYREGLQIGLEAASANARKARPLSEEQFGRMFGLDHLRDRLLAARAEGATRLLLWRRGKAAEQIVELARDLGISFVALVEDNPVYLEERSLGGLPTCRPEKASVLEADAAIVGSLSPGASLDLLAEAERYLADLPIIDPVARLEPAAVSHAA